MKTNLTNKDSLQSYNNTIDYKTMGRQNISEEGVMYILVLTTLYGRRREKKMSSGFLTRSCSNQPTQLQRLARVMPFYTKQA